MPKQSYRVLFKGALPGERIWVHICSRNGPACCPLSTWTDDTTLDLELDDCPAAAGVAGGQSEHTLLAFTRERRPVCLLLDPTKVAANGNYEIGFEGEVELPINVWILAGDFDRQKLRALNSVLVANAILNEENTGIRIVVKEIIDAVNEAKGSRLEKDFGWSNIDVTVPLVEALGRNLTPRRPFNPMMVNVFFTDSIHDDDDRRIHGMHGGSGQRQTVTLDRFAFDDLLVHELGHALGLGDLDGEGKPVIAAPAGVFSEMNVMRQFALMRCYFTEGQIARMHFAGNGFLKSGFDSQGPNPWYGSVNSNGAISEDVALANDPPDVHAQKSFLAVLSHLRSIDHLEDIISTSRNRFAQRSRQLSRELKTGFGGSDLPLLIRMSVEEYVASDIIRLFEYYTNSLRISLVDIARLLDPIRDELITMANAIPFEPNQFVNQIRSDFAGLKKHAEDAIDVDA